MIFQFSVAGDITYRGSEEKYSRDGQLIDGYDDEQHVVLHSKFIIIINAKQLLVHICINIGTLDIRTFIAIETKTTILDIFITLVPLETFSTSCQPNLLPLYVLFKLICIYNLRLRLFLRYLIKLPKVIYNTGVVGI